MQAGRPLPKRVPFELSEMIRPTPESSKKAKKRSNFSVSLSSRVKEGNKMTLDVVKYDMAKKSPEQRYFTKWGTFSVKCLFLLTKKNFQWHVAMLLYNLCMEYKDAIKLLKERMLVSQVELAKILSVSFATVNRWDNGLHDSTYAAKRKFKKLFDKNDIRIGE